jgi:hypothetical protein
MKETWLQNLWLLTHTFKATKLVFHEEDQVTGLQEGDRPLMSEFFCVGYQGKELEVLNIVRRYQNLLHVSDIVKCDGHTINKFVVSDFSELST